MKKVLIVGSWLAIFGFPYPAWGQSRPANYSTRFQVQYDRAFANNSQSNVSTAEIGAKFNRTGEVFARYLYDSRKYKSDVQYRADHLFSFGTILSFTSNIYSELTTGFARSPKFSPNTYVDLLPHYVFFDSTDLAIGLKYRVYRHAKDVLLGVLAVQRPLLGEDFLIGLVRGDFVLRPKWEVAGSGGLQTNFWNSRLRLQAVLGGGKSYEGANLVDRFWSADFLAGIKVADPFFLKLNYLAYRGRIRDENRVGGGMEFFF